MKSLRVKAPADLDNPERWNRRLRPWFDVAAYQRRIDQVVGLNKDRKSIIVLRWAQDVDQILFNEATPRYWTKRRREGDALVYYKPARWVLEKRLEPEQYKPSWEAKRFSLTDPEGNVLDQGEAPEEYHTFAYLIAEHEVINPSDGWPACCTRKFYENRGRCWGRYKQPGDDDIDLIAQATRQMEAEKFRNPYAPLTASELAEAEIAANMQVERAEEQFEQYEREMMADFNRLHGWRLFNTDPGAIRWHDVGAAYTKQKGSGVFAPDKELITP